MKAIKITLTVILLAAMGVGLYYILRPTPHPDTFDLTIPKGCPLNLNDTLYLDSVFHTIAYGDFEQLKNRRAEFDNTYQNITQKEGDDCKQTAKNMVEFSYYKRFLELTNNEFSAGQWPHVVTIKQMNDDLLQISQNNGNLKSIKRNCSDYMALQNYNNQIDAQCKQKPSSIESKWDGKNTKQLIDRTISTADPVTHTNIYNETRTDKVRARLYYGHLDFLKKLVTLAKKKIQEDPTQENYYNVYNTVTNEIDRFQGKSNGKDEFTYSDYYHKFKSERENAAKPLIDTLNAYSRFYVRD